MKISCGLAAALGWLLLAATRLEAAGIEKASHLRQKHNGTNASLQ